MFWSEVVKRYDVNKCDIDRDDVKQLCHSFVGQFQVKNSDLCFCENEGVVVTIYLPKWFNEDNFMGLSYARSSSLCDFGRF